MRRGWRKLAPGRKVVLRQAIRPDFLSARYFFGGQVVVRPATLQDARAVAAELREAERRELWSAYRLTPEAVCEYAVRNSERALAVVYEGKPLFIFGVRTISLVGSKGYIWLLTTEEIVRLRHAVQKYTLAYVEALLEEWEVLENFVLFENKLALRWLKRAGFQVSRPFELGFDKDLFVRIRRERRG